MKFRRNLFLASFAVIALSQVATAATYNWIGGFGTWDTATANWTGAGPTWPAISTADDDAVFGGTAGTVTIATGGVTANDLTFNTTGYTIGGAGLTLDGASLTSILTTGPGVSATISSVISGGASLTKQGGGTLTLSGANSFTGAVGIKEGILRAGNGAALGSNIDGTTIEPGATLDVNGQNLGTEIVTVSGAGVDGNGAIINTGGQQINAFGRLVLAGDTTFGGPNRWDLRNSSPTFDMAGHTLTKTGANYLGLIGAAVSNAGNVVINQGELSLTFASSFGGVDATNNITVNSGATLSFYQSSAVHGSILNLNDGATLRGENNNNATQNTWAGPVNVTGAVTFRADGAINLENTISGTANLTKIGGSTITVSASGSLAHTGDLTVNAGTLTVNGPLANTGNIIVNAGTLNANATLTQTGDVTVNGGSLNVAGTGSFTGAVRLNAGTLALNYATDDNSKLPDDKALTLAGGTLSLAGGTHNEVVASTTLVANTASTVSSSGHTGLLGLKTITPEAGASVNFSASLIATTDNLNTNGILGTWATVAGNDWAVNDANAADGAVKAYDGYVFTFGIADDAALYQNKHVNVDTVQTPNAAITPLSLVFNTPYANGLTLQGTNTIATGGILVGANVGANASTISGGNLTGPADGDLVLNQRNTGNSLTIGSVIIDNGTSGLLKTGLGTAILTAANSYTGTTTVAAGSLQINDPAAIGGSQVVIGGSSNASLLLGDNLVVPATKSITIAGGGAGQFYGALSTASGNTGTSEWQGPVTIGALTGTRIGTLGGTLLISGNIGEAAAGSQLLVRNNETVGGTTILSGNNTFTGGLQLVVGNLRMASANALGSGTLSLGSGGNANAFSSDGSTSRTIANPVALTATGTIGLGDATLNGKLLFTNTVDVGNADRTVSTASDVEISGNLAGTAILFKAGAATLTLSNANSLTGQVRINGGTLVVSHKDALATCLSVHPTTTGGGGTLRLATNESVVVNRMETSSSNPGTVLSDRATLGDGINHVIPAGWFGANTYTFAAGPNVTGGTARITFNSGNLTAGNTNATVLNPTTAVITIDGPVNIGLNNYAKTLRLDGASSGNLISGPISNGLNTLSIAKTGTSTWELSGVNSQTGATTVSNGTLILSGNRVAGSGAITVGNTAGETGILEIKGDLPLGNQEFGVGTNLAGATGIVNHSAGKVSFGSGNALLIGRTIGGVSGTYNLSGGELQTYSSTSRGVMIGVNAGSAGSRINAAFNLSGTGYLNNATGTLQVVRGDATSSYQNSSYNQTGGESKNSNLLIGGNGGNGANSIASFSVTGGTFSADNFTNLSRGNTVDSTMTIGGTAEVTLPAFPTARGTSSTATLYFDGGTLKPRANADSPAYISGLTNVFIMAGGAEFDTNGFQITVSQSLLTDTVSTSGGLTKAGAGTLSLTAANTYTGPTTVNAGTLSLGNGTANTNLADGANVIVSSGATLHLNYSGTDTVNSLWLGGVQKPAGVYGSSDPSGLITGSGTLTVTSGPSGDDYSIWAGSGGFNLAGGPSDDDDKDGLTNFEEYAFGLNPTTGSSVNPVIQPLNKGTGTFKYTRRATPATSGVAYTYESSTTLSGAWPGFTPVSAVSNNASPVEEITVTVPAALLANPEIFIRVKAVK